MIKQGSICFRYTDDIFIYNKKGKYHKSNQMGPDVQCLIVPGTHTEKKADFGQKIPKVYSDVVLIKVGNILSH